VPTTSHHFINSSVPNSLDSIPSHASSGLCHGQYLLQGVFVIGRGVQRCKMRCILEKVGSLKLDTER
jgi:hypothetical protein